MKRNDVVLVGKPDMYNFYGRINRMVDSYHAEVICCGKHFQIYPIYDLRLDNAYKGNEHGRMPTLRKLKQMASQYNNKVWKKNRKRTTSHETE